MFKPKPRPRKKLRHHSSVVVANMLALRKERGMTQVQFAKNLGLDLSKLARTEVGLLKPSVELVELLMNKLNVTADDLFHPRGESTAKEKDIREMAKGLRSLNEKQRASVQMLINLYQNGGDVKVEFGRLDVER